MSERNRLDVLLVERGLTDSREKAKKLIKDGFVKLNGTVITKPSTDIDVDSSIEICGGTIRYVGRGGLKLEKAVSRFNIDLVGKVCMDIGASTGGFTDCMLQNGAVKVYAVDVGSGQLAQKLIDDARVVNMEKTNFRYLSNDAVEDKIDFISVDVSFISLRHIIPAMSKFMKIGGTAVCLVKPQFEAGKSNIGKNGIVKDLSVHIGVAEEIYDFAVNCGFAVDGFDYSPIKGGDGNIEYLIYFSNCESLSSVGREEIRKVVTDSHKTLKNGGA